LIATTSHCQKICCYIGCCIIGAGELSTAFSRIPDAFCAHVSLRTARLGCQILLEYQILLRRAAAALIIFIKFNSTSILAVPPFEEMNDLCGPVLLLQEIVLPTVLQSERSGLGHVRASLLRYGN
jgi:hypothetical protein